MRQVILIGGGVRSGKSAFALELARKLGRRRAFVATAEALDDEMAARIEAHARERGDEFQTIEAPLALIAALRGIGDADVVVVDCLTVWLSNLLLRGDSADGMRVAIEELATTLAARRFHCVLVSNEVGMGVVPETALGRAFRDQVGRAHQRLAQVADEIYFAVLGTMLRIKPEPICVQTRRGAYEQAG